MLDDEIIEMVDETNIKPINKKKIWHFLIVLIIILMVGFSICLLVFNSKKKKSHMVAALPITISAMINDEGTAFLPFMEDNNVIEVQGNVLYAYSTSDRKYVAVLEKDHKLSYFMSSKQENRTTISTHATKIIAIRDSGLIYSDEIGVYYRYLFSDDSTVSLGQVSNYLVSMKELNIAYADSDENIYYLLESAADKEKISTYSDSIYINEISNDGKTIVYTEENDEKKVIYLFENDIKTKITEFDNSLEAYKYTEAEFNYNSTFLTIGIYNYDEMFLKNKDQELQKVKLGHPLAAYHYDTVNGYLYLDCSDKIDGLYVTVYTDADDLNLYYIDAMGEREKIISNIGQYKIVNKKIYYTDAENYLYCASLNKSELGESKKISSDVCDFMCSPDGKFVYYIKNCSRENKGVLYVWNDNSDTVKISSNANCYYYESGYGALSGMLSEDGRTIYYYEDVEDIGDTYNDSGTLYRYTIGSNEPKKIASDAVVYSLDSGLRSGIINPKSFIYAKYMSVDEDENLYVDWYYYNGSESKKIISDVKK